MEEEEEERPSQKVMELLCLLLYPHLILNFKESKK